MPRLSLGDKLQFLAMVRPSALRDIDRLVDRLVTPLRAEYERYLVEREAAAQQTAAAKVLQFKSLDTKGVH